MFNHIYKKKNYIVIIEYIITLEANIKLVILKKNTQLEKYLDNFRFFHFHPHEYIKLE